MKRVILVALSCVLVFFLISCQTNTVSNNKEDRLEETASNNKDEKENNNNHVNDENQANNENNENDNTDKQLGIKELSDQLIEALHNKEMSVISELVHEEKGLLFSPYVYVEKDAVVFDKEDVALMLDDEQTFNWGLYDGKGTPIELTPAKYVEEFLDMSPYIHPDDVLINDMQDRGNTLNNLTDIFPEADIIEYYHGGSEEYAGIDWSSILFVYEYDEAEKLKLVAIVRDMWTI